MACYPNILDVASCIDVVCADSSGLEETDPPQWADPP
jgi:hypothetical protein